MNVSCLIPFLLPIFHNTNMGMLDTSKRTKRDTKNGSYVVNGNQGASKKGVSTSLFLCTIIEE